LIQSESVVIDMTTDSKPSALYFDSMIPITIGFHIWRESTDDPNALLLEILEETLPRNLIDSDDFMSSLERCIQNNIDLCADAVSAFTNGDSLPPTNPTHANDVRNLLKTAGYYKSPMPIRFSKSKTEIEILDSDITKNQGILLELTNLELINIENATWKQIIEVRKDSESMMKLRKLVHFYSANYDGKDAKFIEDDISIKLYEYDKAVKKWGFETTTSSAGIILNSKSLLATAGFSLASILGGSDSLALVLVSGGAFIEIGKIALHIAEKNFEKKQLQETHDLSYLISANEKLS
jgi:hypothetical protein